LRIAFGTESFEIASGSRFWFRRDRRRGIGSAGAVVVEAIADVVIAAAVAAAVVDVDVVTAAVVIADDPGSSPFMMVE